MTRKRSVQVAAARKVAIKAEAKVAIIVMARKAERRAEKRTAVIREVVIKEEVRVIKPNIFMRPYFCYTFSFYSYINKFLYSDKTYRKCTVKLAYGCETGF